MSQRRLWSMEVTGQKIREWSRIMLTISLHTMLFGAFAIFAAPDVQPTNVDELQLADEVQEDAMQPADEFQLADEFQDAEVSIDEEELEYTDGDERAARW